MTRISASAGARKLVLAGLLTCEAAIAGPTFVYTEVAVLGASGTAGDGINNHNQIVGNYQSGGSTSTPTAQGFLDTNGTYTTIDFLGAHGGSGATGINDAGTIVGGYLDASGLSHAYIDVGGVFSTRDPPRSISADAEDINDAGEIVGTFRDAAGQHGFQDVGGVYTTITLPFPGVASTRPYEINDLGQIIGHFIVSGSGQEHGFLLSGGAFTQIDGPSVTAGTYALGINDAGRIVGGYGVGPTAFLLDSSGFTPLEPPWSVDSGTSGDGINDSGVIVGNGADFSGVERTFIGSGWVFPVSCSRAAAEIVSADFLRTKHSIDLACADVAQSVFS